MWELSGYEIERLPAAHKDAGSNKVYYDHVLVKAENHPKGMARIVDMEDSIIRDFPEQE